MVIQYPHRGKLFIPGSTVKGLDGKWPGSSLELQFETRCRAEPASSNQFIIGQGGERISFKCIVYIPLPKIVVSSADVPSAAGSQKVYAGDTVIYSVPLDMVGENEVTLSDLAGVTNFSLKVDGRPLILDTEYEKITSGFRLIGSGGSLISGQRFEITKLYVFNISQTGSSGVMVSGDFDMKPGSLFEVWDGETLKVAEKIKQFSKGQLNARVWL
jgi:hypothetical protein